MKFRKQLLRTSSIYEGGSSVASIPFILFFVFYLTKMWLPFGEKDKNKMALSSRMLLITLLSIVVSFAIADEVKQTVTYDGRSLIINGKRELLYSGSIHYTRSTPEMWPDLLEKAKHGGLNVIQSYVFWNVHEPVEGKLNFEGNYDVVKFFKLIQEKGMYITLRIGPFIQAEWSHGALPYWLREVPDVIFRCDNEPFKKYMQAFTTKIVEMLKQEKLFASQGGPIILSQIENEYDHVQLAYREKGTSYTQWAAKMAVGLDTGVPWIMCKQTNAPDPVINTCNGRHCGDTFTGPNKPYKPAIWTENWTAQYRVFGDPPSERSAEDLAYSVARFFAKNGSLVNYYMYHGGTNFGRTSSAFVTTRYYDEAPLDEYGLQREPKWGHLKDVHKALNLCKRALIAGESKVQKLNEHHEIIVFEKPGSDICAAFITNNHSKTPATINFRGQDIYMPPHSISILPDCKTVVYNTQTIVSQHNSKNFEKSKVANNFKWEMYSETIPTTQQVPADQKDPKELYGWLKDTTDYAWYTTKFEVGPEDMPRKKGITPVLRITSLGHALLAFVNGVFVGSNHGTHEEKNFQLQRPVNFTVGVNYITILAMTLGLPDSGAYMEHRFAGPKSIVVLGLQTGTTDLTVNGWGHRVGLKGENDQIYSEEGSKKVNWKPVNGPGPAVSWYKTRFDTPEGRDPVAIRMTAMKKGMVWVNGKSIGRYWMSYLSPLGTPTQSEYHIPRSFLNPKDNLLVVFEEEDAEPKSIEILTVNRDTICSVMTEYHLPSVNSWASKNMKFHTVVDEVKTEATLRCPNHKKVVAVEFASFGDPVGACGMFSEGDCNPPGAKQIVEQQCLGKEACSIARDPGLFMKGGDKCPNVPKSLAIQLRCSS